MRVTSGNRGATDRRRGRLAVRAAALGALFGLLAAAPAPVRAQAELTAWHTVRPGESLIHITRNYLGSGARWRENWELNPGIENPDFIEPGTRIRVIVAPQSSVPAARLQALSGRVDGRPLPIDWKEARRDDLLLVEDGLRTARDASTEMVFPDGSSVLLSDESLVFFRGEGRSLIGVEQRSVEIVEGQADIVPAPRTAAGPEIEILVGDTRAISRGGDTGKGQARARKSDAGGTALMVFEGDGEVSAAGQKVEVPRGMGTAIPEGAPPPPPEKLLPAPVGEAPADGSEWMVPNPGFSWSAVDGASSYTVDICRDAECTLLVRRVGGIPGVVWTPDPPLPVAELFWRVSAVSESGLDGYASKPHAFAVLSDRLDEEPPTGRLSLVGDSVMVNGRPYYRGDVAVEVTVEDEVSGVADWTPRVGGEEVDRSRLAGPWESGSFTVGARVVDRRGNEGSLDPISFEVDETPPEFTWEIGGAELLDARIGAGTADRKWSKRQRKWLKRASRDFARTYREPVWTILAWGDAETPIAGRFRPKTVLRSREQVFRVFRITGDRPEVLILASGLEVPGETGDAAGGRLIWLTAVDRESGVVEELSVRTERDEEAGGDEDAAPRFRLVFEAADRLGNRDTVGWPFAAPAAGRR